MKTYVAIPFKDEPEITISIINQLVAQDEFDWLMLMDNGSTEESSSAVIEAMSDKCIYVRWPDYSIYEMWNNAWLDFQKFGDEEFNLAILNNDITIPENYLSTLARFLRSDDEIWLTYADYQRNTCDGTAPTLSGRETTGTYGHGGMSGCAFMVKGEILNQGMPLVDTQFEWWCGDDDIAQNIAKLGKKMVRVVGLPLDHVNEKTARNGENEWIHEAKGRDLARLWEKWRVRV